MNKVKFKTTPKEAQLCFLDDNGFVHDFYRQHSKEWSADEVDNLRYNLLQDTLRILLDGRASKKQVQEALDWISRDDISPFSFRVCAENEYCNFITLRESLLLLYKKYQAVLH